MTVSISIHGSLGLDGSRRKPTMDFLEKLAEDPTSPGLHVEPIIGSVDPRARTGRVNRQYRAVMFELTDEYRHHFVIVGVYNHDEGIEKAKKVRLTVNPVNGITELIEEITPEAPRPADTESRRKAETAAEEARRLAERQAAERDAEDSAKGAVAVEIPRPADVFTASGLTPQLLEAELGIDPTATRIVLGLDSEDTIEQAMSGSPRWERDALLGLVAGLSVDEVRTSLGIEPRKPDDQPDERTEDERTIDGLQTPAARMEFAYLEEVNTDELRKVIDSRDFDAWRVFIHPDQQVMVDRDFSGSGRVLGGAGTGKTVVTVHRANRLVTSGGKTPTLEDNPPRVLLTTYTRGLADSLKSQMNALNPAFPEAGEPGEPGLWISGVDALVVKMLANTANADIERATEAVLGRASKRAKPFTGNEEREYWMDALLVADQEDLPAELANLAFLEQEFESVVLTNGITMQAEYLRVARPGRGTPLNRAGRRKVWAVIQAFMNATARDGKLAWPAMAAVAATLLDNRAADGKGRLFDHVLVDEAQDFHAGHWRFLRACVEPGPNDIFLAEDSHQRIYGQRHVLSHFGISTRGRASRRLTLNYRTTRENLDYALKMLTGEWIGAEGEGDSVAGYRSARSGPLPRLLRFGSEAEEFDAVADLIAGWQDQNPDARIGILTRTRPLISRVVNALADHGITAVKTKNAELASHETVSVMTMHGAKGMEFTHVILLSMGREMLPLRHQLTGLGEGEREDALQRERALLYVAASRARDELVVTVHGQPSELLPTG